MANIGTGFIRLIPKLPIREYLKVGEILNQLLTWDGMSYHVPVFVRQHETTFVTDIQLGGKYSGTGGVQDVWDEYAELLDAIWWCNFNDGGDHDIIGWITAKEDSLRRPNHGAIRSRYGFDRLEITWKPGGVQLDTADYAWEKSLDSWTLRITGSYYAGNDRCSLLMDIDPVMPTQTTATRGLESDISYWHLDEFEPSDIQDILNAYNADAARIAFYWRDRCVQLKERDHHTKWRTYHMDDWDNCVDPNWLAYTPPQPTSG